MTEKKRLLKEAKEGLEKAIGDIDRITYDPSLPADLREGITKTYTQLGKAYKLAVKYVREVS